MTILSETQPAVRPLPASDRAPTFALFRKVFFWIFDLFRKVPFWICVIALTSLALVVILHSLATKQSIDIRYTWLPILMGLLGSSAYVMYNLYNPSSGLLRSKDIGNPTEEWTAARIFVRIFLGPIAGWLSYAIAVGQQADQQGGQLQPTTGYILLWLPFVAGFSSDLLVGIINQGEKAIKVTLGIRSEERTNQN